jgi:hypothetical protein
LPPTFGAMTDLVLVDAEDEASRRARIAPRPVPDREFAGDAVELGGDGPAFHRRRGRALDLDLTFVTCSAW